MKVIYGIFLIALLSSNTNGLPITKVQYSYLPLWSGNHILIGNVFRKIKESNKFATVYTKKTETFVTTETPIVSTSPPSSSSTISKTSFESSTSEVLLNKKLKVDQHKIKICNYDYIPLWSGNHILIGNIFRKITESRTCVDYKKTDTSTTTVSPIGSTLTSNILMSSFGITTPEVLPTQSPKLAPNKKKVCKTAFRALPKISLNNMMTFKQFFKPITKCHWIESETEKGTISTVVPTTSSTSMTSQPPSTTTRPLEIYDVFLRV